MSRFSLIGIAVMAVILGGCTLGSNKQSGPAAGTEKAPTSLSGAVTPTISEQPSLTAPPGGDSLKAIENDLNSVNMNDSSFDTGTSGF